MLHLTADDVFKSADAMAEQVAEALEPRRRKRLPRPPRRGEFDGLYLARTAAHHFSAIFS